MIKNTLAIFISLIVLYNYAKTNQNQTDTLRIPTTPPRLTLDAALQTIPEVYSVSPDVVQVLLDKESYGGRMDAYRFEPSQMTKAARITKDPNKQRMLASSHCAFSVMGLTALDKHVDWYELYDPVTCVEVGVSYFAKQKERCQSLNPKEPTDSLAILRCAARRYNGSGPRAQRYADDFINRLKIKRGI